MGSINENGSSGHPNGGSASDVHMAAIPYPGAGHINPLLNLCRLIASKGVQITFVVTEEWVGLLGSRISSLPPNLRIRSIPNVLPSEHVRGSVFTTFIEAVYTKMIDPVEELLRSLDPPVMSVLSDSSLPWGWKLAERMDLPIASLRTQSAMSFLALLCNSKKLAGEETPDALKGIVDDPLVYLPKTSPKIFPSHEAYLQRVSWFTKAQSLLFTSCYDIESQVIDAFKVHYNMPVYTLGPTIPFMTLSDTETVANSAYFRWLDAQPPSSVLYVSLGSFLPMAGPQKDEMKRGLQESGSRFLWVIRGVPEPEPMGETGLAVSWCDQLRVLCHPSVGGFLTHCGWNSSMEGAYAGLPMLTCPLIWDQYSNSKLVTEYWKVGLTLKEEGEDGDGVVIGWERIAGKVKELMDLEGEESVGRRRRAEELKESCRRALEKGGSTVENLESYVQDIISRKPNKGA